MCSDHKIKVVLADDHAVLREGIVRYIEKHSDFIEFIGETSDWKGLMKLLRSKIHCDVALLDIMMPGGDGLDAVKNILSEFPDIKVLMISAHSEKDYAMRFINAGASGFISKVGSIKEIIPAIRDVAEGKIVLSESLKKEMALKKTRKRESSSSLEGLTDREFQVLVQLGSGKSPSEVAKFLHLSPKTVSTHRNNIIKKMNWKHNGELIFYAIQKGLVSKL